MWSWRSHTLAVSSQSVGVRVDFSSLIRCHSLDGSSKGYSVRWITCHGFDVISGSSVMSESESSNGRFMFSLVPKSPSCSSWMTWQSCIYISNQSLTSVVTLDSTVVVHRPDDPCRRSDWIIIPQRSWSSKCDSSQSRLRVGCYSCFPNLVHDHPGCCQAVN